MMYELIDTTDNDCHDTGTREEIMAWAEKLNADERGDMSVKQNRWACKPEGFSAANFKFDEAER